MLIHIGRVDTRLHANTLEAGALLFSIFTSVDYRANIPTFTSHDWAKRFMGWVCVHGAYNYYALVRQVSRFITVSVSG